VADSAVSANAAHTGLRANILRNELESRLPAAEKALTGAHADSSNVNPATSVTTDHAGPPLLQRSKIMQDHGKSATGRAKCIPWNKGKLPGAKPPLRPKHVRAIRTKPQVEGRKRDLAFRP
jgi:hypothetical protein